MRKKEKEISDDEIQVIGGKKRIKADKSMIAIYIFLFGALFSICALETVVLSV